MAFILDNVDEIIQKDTQKMYSSIEKLSDQIMEVSKQVDQIKLPAAYKKAKNIVYIGMGGSALGAHCIKSLFSKDLKIPMEIVNDYEIPSIVNKDTLVFISSYSGKTEETISGLKMSLAKKAKILIITSGGELAEIARKKNIPALIFGTKNNPCGSPRMGLGYTLFSPLLILSKLGILKFGKEALRSVIEVAVKYDKKFGLKNPADQNTAKKFADQLSRGSVWYVAADHLAGNAHVAANQMNENAKRFGGYFLIPELNHHLLEGLSYPKEGRETFVFLESKMYGDRILKRFAVTKEILLKQQREFVTYDCEENKTFLQMVEVLVLGSYLSYYSAILEGIDPTAIPTVDFLKNALKSK